MASKTSETLVTVRMPKALVNVLDNSAFNSNPRAPSRGREIRKAIRFYLRHKDTIGA